MKLLNSSSSHGWCRRFFKWVGERERERYGQRERERDMGRERERLFIDGMGGMGAEMVK
jgi:hypothetical protein